MFSHRNLLALVFTGSVLLSAPLAAQMVGDPETGKTKATVCAGCHGVDGNSNFPEWPKLAGQHEQYIVRQVKNFQSKNRNNALMYPMIANLSEQDSADIGAYFARQKVKPGTADETVVALGESLYRGGAAARGIPACLACHGPTGRGNPGAGYPMLGGQHSVYTASVLNRFKGGKVWGEGEDANAVMASIAGRLTEEEITALASYIEGLY